MLGIAKRVAYEALLYGAPLRETQGESACAFEALPQETGIGVVAAVRFKIEVRKNEEVNAYAILLGGSIELLDGHVSPVFRLPTAHLSHPRVVPGAFRRE
jgi:hypothetical protein